jgi:hypothetical protein
VSAVGPGSVTVRASGSPFTIPLRTGSQLPTSLVGQFVPLTLNLSESGPTAEEDDQGEDNDDQGEDENDDDGTGQQAPAEDGDTGDA